MTQVLLSWVTRDKGNGFSYGLDSAQPESLQSSVISWWCFFEVLHQFLGNAQVLGALSHLHVIFYLGATHHLI